MKEGLAFGSHARLNEVWQTEDHYASAKLSKLYSILNYITRL